MKFQVPPYVLLLVAEALALLLSTVLSAPQEPPFTIDAVSLAHTARYNTWRRRWRWTAAVVWALFGLWVLYEVQA